MGLIASKFAFFPPKVGEPSFSARQDYCTTASGVNIPIVVYPVKNSKYTIVYSHGNAEDIIQSEYFLKQLSQKLDASIVAYEYPGYGCSYQEADEDSSIGTPRLTPSEEGCYEAATACFEYLTNHLRVPLHQQIWMGESIGSGPTVDIVSRLCKNKIRIGGMILINPFWSATTIVSKFLTFIYDMFPNGSKIATINVPILILHAENDTVVPQIHSQWLHEHAQNSERHLIAHAKHNTVLGEEQTVYTIIQFLGNLD